MELPDPDHGIEAYVGLRIRTADRKITFKLAVLLCSFTSGRRDATPSDAQIVSTRQGSLQAGLWHDIKCPPLSGALAPKSEPELPGQHHVSIGSMAWEAWGARVHSSDTALSVRRNKPHTFAPTPNPRNTKTCPLRQTRVGPELSEVPKRLPPGRSLSRGGGGVNRFNFPE